MSEQTFTDSDRAKFAALVAKVWSDSDLEARYSADGRSVLAENGITLDAGTPVPPIPEKPEGDISVEQLDAMAAGGCFSTVACPVSTLACFSAA